MQKIESTPVLLAEDDDDERRMFCRLLKHFGWDVIEAEDGETALELTEENGIPPLLITDIMMPGMNGIELAGKLRQKDPQMPVIFITGYAGEWSAELYMMDNDRTVVLKKPFPGSQLAETINQLLNTDNPENRK